MNIVYSVRSDSPQAPPLRWLVDHPREHLGLDVWQVKPDYVVLRASEEQAARLRQMGYTTEEVVETENHLSPRSLPQTQSPRTIRRKRSRATCISWPRVNPR